MLIESKPPGKGLRGSSSRQFLWDVSCRLLDIQCFRIRMRRLELALRSQMVGWSILSSQGILANMLIRIQYLRIPQ